MKFKERIEFIFQEEGVAIIRSLIAYWWGFIEINKKYQQNNKRKPKEKGGLNMLPD